MLRIPAKQPPKPSPAAPPADDPTDEAPNPSTPEGDPGEAPPDEEPDGDETPSGPGQKVPQPLVLYMGSDMGPFQCDHCCYFAGPSSCQVVDGDIDPAGCCNLFCPADDADGGAGLDAAPPDADDSAPPSKEMM